MIPSSAAMLKNLEQRPPSNFRMENLLQSKTTTENDFSFTLNNWAASLMARQWEQKTTAAAVAAAAAAANNLEFYKRSRRDLDAVGDLETVDADLETETEPETDGELTYRERLIQIRLAKRLKTEDKRIHHDDERLSGDMDSERDWVGFDGLNDPSTRTMTRSDERISGEETCSANCADDQCVRGSNSPPVHSFTSTPATESSRGIQAKEKPELKFGVKAILADNYDRRRNTGWYKIFSPI